MVKRALNEIFMNELKQFNYNVKVNEARNFYKILKIQI